MTHVEPCPACATPLQGRFCHACGQDTNIGPQPIGEMVAEGVEEITSLDSKGLRTLATLAVDPGRLLSAYRDGASQLYITPLKLFALTTAFFLALLALTNVVLYQFTWKVQDPTQPVSVLEVVLDDETRLSNAQSTDLWMQKRVDPPVDPQIYAALEQAAAGDVSAEELASLRYDVHLTREQTAISDRLAAWLPNVLWLLAPLFALLLVPLFGRKRLFAEHLAFSFWAHATAFALLMGLAAVNAFGAGVSAIWLLPPYIGYFALAARRFYDQGWAAASLKAVIHTGAYVGLVLGPVAVIVAATAVDWTAWADFANS